MKSRRREFLAAVAVSTVACGGHPSRWRFLTQTEADTLQVVCAHIIPSDHDPGAVEAGVVDFIDLQLSGFYKLHQKAYRDGIAALDALSVKTNGAPFVKLNSAQQLALLKTLDKKKDAFFNLAVTHSMQGFYGSPRHGGNRDGVSWAMLGVSYPPVRGRA